MRQICRIAFIFHKFIHRQQLLNERFSGFFTGVFHKTSELSTISTEKTVHNVDKYKICACEGIESFLMIVD